MRQSKQAKIQHKKNYPGSVASYNTRPGNEVGLFYNAPEPIALGHARRRRAPRSALRLWTVTQMGMDRNDT